MRYSMTLLYMFSGLLGLYLVILAVVYLNQSRMVYFPDAGIVADPGDIGLDYRDVFLDTGDGVRIHGWFVPAGPDAPVMLYLHGNGGNISHRLESIAGFHEMGLAMFIIDYRGYGRSNGKPDEAGTYADAEAAWRYLVEKEGIPAGELIIFGRSLGSGVAVDLAARHAPRALIVHSGFPALTDVGQRAYPWLPVKLLSRIRYDSGSRITQITCPKLFIHSLEDDIVPYEMGRRLFDLAPEPKTFLDTGGTHNVVFLGSKASGDAVARFISDIAGSSRSGDR